MSGEFLGAPLGRRGRVDTPSDRQEQAAKPRGGAIPHTDGAPKLSDEVHPANPTDRHDVAMHVRISGVNLPGCAFCRSDGSVMENVHVGVQLRRDPAHLVRADTRQATWLLDLDVIHTDDGVDFRGPAVQGRRGERFIYLTWGNVDEAGHFEMFRRAKLMLNRVEPDVICAATPSGVLAATVDLTDAQGGPRCARVDPPALVWAALPD